MEKEHQQKLKTMEIEYNNRYVGLSENNKSLTQIHVTHQQKYNTMKTQRQASIQENGNLRIKISQLERKLQQLKDIKTSAINQAYLDIQAEYENKKFLSYKQHLANALDQLNHPVVTVDDFINQYKKVLDEKRKYKKLYKISETNIENLRQRRQVPPKNEKEYVYSNLDDVEITFDHLNKYNEHPIIEEPIVKTKEQQILEDYIDKTIAEKQKKMEDTETKQQLDETKYIFKIYYKNI